MKKVDFDKKWAELLQYALENTTRQGMHTGIKWLQNAFNDYLKLTDETPGYGMGGQPAASITAKSWQGRYAWSSATMSVAVTCSTRPRKPGCARRWPGSSLIRAGTAV